MTSNLTLYSEFWFLMSVELVGLISAIRSVTSANPVSSVLWLVLVFLSFATVLVYIGAEFLGFSLVVVYVGAISVLFLFVVMMLDVRTSEVGSDSSRYFPVYFVLVGSAALISSVLVYPLSSDLFSGLAEPVVWVDRLYALQNIELVGYSLFTRFFDLFILSGMVLFIAMIGAIEMALDGGSDPVSGPALFERRQLISEQVSRPSGSRLPSSR